jgi:hypothetical protein
VCTLSLIPLHAPTPALRLVINRDESDSRPPAIPPRWHEVCTARALWPTDPAGGGTWVAATTHGLALALLNRNLEPKPILPAGLASRGTIIPSIARADSAADALSMVRELALARIAPFRLVIASAHPDAVRAAVCTWDRRELLIEHAAAPLCLASSGLGDSLVQVRLPLFDDSVRAAPTPSAQDAFHAHAWPDRPELSVLMRRPGYRTVSVTTVEVAGGSAEMWYQPV